MNVIRNSVAFLVVVTVCFAVPFGRFDLAEQQDIADFSHSNKHANVFLPFRDTPERLIDTDDEVPYTSDDDIFYIFATLPTDKLSGPKRHNGFF